jgi:hypothetical protein
MWQGGCVHGISRNRLYAPYPCMKPWLVLVPPFELGYYKGGGNQVYNFGNNSVTVCSPVLLMLQHHSGDRQPLTRIVSHTICPCLIFGMYISIAEHLVIGPWRGTSTFCFLSARFEINIWIAGIYTVVLLMCRPWFMILALGGWRNVLYAFFCWVCLSTVASL